MTVLCFPRCVRREILVSINATGDLEKLPEDQFNDPNPNKDGAPERGRVSTQQHGPPDDLGVRGRIRIK